MKAGSRLNPVIGEYWFQARRYLLLRGEQAITTADVQRTAEWLRYTDFRRHIEPLEKQRNRILSMWVERQPMPVMHVTLEGGEMTTQLVPLPDWLTEAVKQWDELIAIEARRFGYGEETVDTGGQKG